MKRIVPIALVVMAALAAENPPAKHVFSPRMDYEEWKPLGRGDPLKNDPTYDYVPPVLDQVHYWIDPRKRTPDPPLPKSDVMVLGTHTEIPVTSTTTPQATSRLGTIPLLDPILRFMDASKVGFSFSSPAGFFRPTPSPQYYSPPKHYSQPFPKPTDYGPPPPPPSPQKIQALQRPPYTMLMPPPPPATEIPDTSFGTSTKTTTPSESFTNAPSTTSSEATAITTSTSNITVPPVTTTAIAKIENLYKPVAINMPESVSNETADELSISTPSEQENLQLPLVSLFNDDSNHILYQDGNLPSDTKKRAPQDKQPYHGFLPTTIRTPLSTTTRTLTTDPMFKHYHQPSQPVRPPFYLIIQGHSKVKTYGAGKQKIRPLTSNEISFDDGKTKNEGVDFEEGHRRDRKLRRPVMDDFLLEGEVIQGKPTIELSAKYQTKDQASFRVDESSNVPHQDLNRMKRQIGRKLLAAAGTRDEEKVQESLDIKQLGLESLIALNDDYNSEDVINLLLKEEGQGSGFGGLVTSLLGRSLRSTDEI